MAHPTAATVVPAVARSAPRSERPRSNLPLMLILGTLTVISLAGLPYYRLAQPERVRSPLHAWLKPSGYIGQSAGILALLIFIFLWLYPLRKKVKALAWTGSVGQWLDLHVLVALGMPLLVAIHASYRFDGLIGLGYGAMLVVVLSGVIGKYLYARIPRSRSGLELSLEEVAGQRRAMLAELAAASGLSAEEIERGLVPDARNYEGVGIAGTLVNMVRDDLARWRAARTFRARLGAGGRKLDRRTIGSVTRLARREIALAQQSRMLGATHRVFKFWHVAHRPVAITALIAVAVHVGVVIAVGATWFW